MARLFQDDIFKQKDNSMLSKSIINESISCLFGDILIYDVTNQEYKVLSKIEHIKDESNVIGIVVKDLININETDIILKNYLTTNGIPVPMEYIGKEKFIPAYLKDLFDRYVSKYVRTSIIDLRKFKLSVPNIQQLDYINENIEEFELMMIQIWGKEKTSQFFNRLYDHGVFSTYKNKYYQWLPVKNGKRIINNLTPGMCYEFLPIFRYQF